MIRELRYILAVLIGVSMMSSCADEPLVSGYGEIPEGHATVSAKVSFKPFGSALNGGSRTAGDAIKEIQSLYVVLFDANGDYYKTLSPKFEVKSESREDVGKNENIAEKETPCATFEETIPYGRYYIYAVANCEEFEPEKQYTINELRSINLTWDSLMNNNKNNEMFGYFTNGKSSSKPNGWEAPEVTIASPTVELHAWIRRAASKVTVAYDGSKLNDNVYITIKSVQIKDIPKNCKLGVDYGVENKEGLIENGEIIEYATSGNDGPVITKGGVTWGPTYIEDWKEPYDPAGENGKAHTETSQALFFYENLQGNGEEGTKTDKSINKLIYSDKGKPNGTYVEVKAYYENRRSASEMSKGEITYHFMLGKDVKTDYNAERNCHYKLTLCFNKDANDVDWRIVYDEEPGMYVPDVYYISYLYNQSMKMPLKVVFDATNGRTISWMQGRIIENNWEPDGDASAMGDYYYGNDNDKYYAYGPNPETNVWEQLSGDIGAGNTKLLWLGFLSLRNEFYLNGNERVSKVDPYGGTIGSYAVGQAPYNWWNTAENPDDNVDGNVEIEDLEKERGPLYLRGNYWGSPGEQTGMNTKSIIYDIPFYTRLKQLYTTSGFTGNNPYVGYERTAKVNFTAYMNDNTTITTEKPIKIVQVKRIVNPTGIWRSADNDEPFNVVLKEQDGYGGDFYNLISQGPWSAEILSSTHGNWFTISPTSGVTGSEVKFTYKPSGEADTPRCGIIRVKYHNETCNHLIFVRQGYDPIALGDGGKKWFSFNMKTKDAMTNSPLDEGSLYRYGKWDYPISERNNLQTGLGFGEYPKDNEFIIENNNNKYKWSEIGSEAEGATLNSPVSGAVLPVLADWEELQNKYQHGYGVLYADGASQVANTTLKAFGYRDAYVGDDKEERGMRGVFVYNEDTGANIFFPIGALGYGHRKHSHTTMPGVLRYGTQDVELNDAYAGYHPMLWGLFKQYGAIYWTAQLGNAWDINFDQLDFGTYGLNGWKDYGDGSGRQSDACFLRLIKYE